MKKTIKLLPILASLTLLVGCNANPKLSVKNETLTANEGEKYQQIFNKLYDEMGVDTTAQELLVSVADYVLTKSSFWNKVPTGETKTLYALELEKRLVEKYNDFYASAYKEDGLFDEDLLKTALEEQGYEVVVPTNAVAYKETATALLGYDDLKDKLAYDYADWEKDQVRSIKLDILKEEYIRTQLGSNDDGTIKTSYYEAKKIREVKYFSVATADNAERLKYSNKFEAEFTVNDDLETVALEKLENVWKIKKLEDLAKDFAMINQNAHDALSDHYETYFGANWSDNAVLYAAQQAENTYKDDEEYGYRDIYTVEGREALTKEKISEAKEKLSTYSDSGKYDIYKGYYLKQLDILNTKYFSKVVYTTDGGSVINSSVTTAIKNYTTDSSYLSHKSTASISNTCYIDPNKNGNEIYKDGTTCYVIEAKVYDSDVWTSAATSDESLIEANRALAKIASNVSNCWYYYLTELKAAKEFETNWKEIYTYLNETYSYGEKD